MAKVNVDVVKAPENMTVPFFAETASLQSPLSSEAIGAPKRVQDEKLSAVVENIEWAPLFGIDHKSKSTYK